MDESGEEKPEIGGRLARCAEGFAILDKVGTPDPAKKLGWLARRRLAAARSALEESSQDPGGPWQALWGLAKVARLEGDEAQAATLFAQAAEGISGDAQEEERVAFLSDATLAAMARGDGEAAEAYAREAATLRQNDPSLLTNLALSLLLNEQGKRALGAVTNACKVDPDNGASRQVLEYVRRILDGREPYPERLDV